MAVIRFTDNDLPEIASWEVGKTYKLELEVKMVEKSEITDDMVGMPGEEGAKFSAAFKLVRAKPKKEDYDEWYANVRSSAKE